MPSKASAEIDSVEREEKHKQIFYRVNKFKMIIMNKTQLKFYFTIGVSHLSLRYPFRDNSKYGLCYLGEESTYG